MDFEGAAILMTSSSGILHDKVLIVHDPEVDALLLERTPRGAVDVKGNGEMRTWFLNGRGISGA